MVIAGTQAKVFDLSLRRSCCFEKIFQGKLKRNPQLIIYSIHFSRRDYMSVTTLKHGSLFFVFVFFFSFSKVNELEMVIT